MKNEVEKLDTPATGGGWVVGFVEGEGSFTRTREHRSEKYVYPAFFIVNADVDILRKIRRFFGFGDVNKHGEINRHAIPRGKKQLWHYQVSGFKRCTILRNFFKGRLRTESKQRQFAEWEKLWNRRKK